MGFETMGFSISLVMTRSANKKVLAVWPQEAQDGGGGGGGLTPRQDQRQDLRQD